MKNYITQYKVAFCLSWVVLYLVFPSWISKHLLFQEHGFPNVSFPIARSLVIFGFIMYFSISAFFLNRYFNALTVDKPFIIKIKGLFEHIKNNPGLVIVCCLSVVLHISGSLSVIVLNEVRTLDQTFWMYDILNGYWHKAFDFPIQYLFWVLMFLLVMAKKKKLINFILNYINTVYSTYKSNYLANLFLISLCFVLFNIYAQFFPYYSFNESLQLVRYPPVSRFLNLTTYFAFGISHTGPRILQFTFYLLSAIYLYRTILLFREKETALLGATIYLFSPIVYSYAFIASLESGAVFFAILTSFYLLKFIKDEDDRDIVLATFFIGIGFLYKRGLIIMFIVCFAYLLLNRIMKRDLRPVVHFKVLFLALVPILPWLKIGQTMPPIWSNLTVIDELMAYPLMIQSQISVVLFALFAGSFFINVFMKRDRLLLFFGLFFFAFYCLFTVMEVGKWNHRYALVLYPPIAVFLAQIIFSISQKMRWQHAFKLLFTVLAIYLSIICLLPRTSSSLITYKYKDFETQLFPIDKATDWIREKAVDQEKILVLYMIPYKFYVDRIYPDKEGISQKIFLYLDIGTGAKEIMYPVYNLKRYCLEKNISYVIFSFGPRNRFPSAELLLEKWKMRKYLKENMDHEFTKAAEFSIEDNYVYIYALTERF